VIALRPLWERESDADTLDRLKKDIMKNTTAPG